MLPTLNLDDENFIDIFEKNRKTIPKIYPEWTDYNDHDPGITLLELLSWFKEMQQYHIDQVGTQNYTMFLKLLGVTQKRMTPASTNLYVEPIYDREKIKKGSKFFAGNIVFETTENEILENNRIIGCEISSGENKIIYNDDILNSGSNMKFEIFGDHPQDDDSFTIYFSNHFDIQMNHKIYFEIFDDYEVSRNKIDQWFYPLADVEIQYYSIKGWTKCERFNDYTYGFIQSGHWLFNIDSPMIQKDGQYAIRFVLKHNQYDVVPVLQKIDLNILSILQLDRDCDHIETQIAGDDYLVDDKLAENCMMEIFLKNNNTYTDFHDFKIQNDQGQTKVIFDGFQNNQFDIVYYTEQFAQWQNTYLTGLPNQIIHLENKNIYYDSFEIMIQDENDGLYYKWIKVNDFHCSGPEDRHYILDEENGYICFGDCEKGMAPMGRLLITRFALSIGEKGNVKKNKINHLYQDTGTRFITNISDISNGQNKESVNEAFQRFDLENKKIYRAITYEDYEKLILETPGLRIKRVKAITQKNSVNQENQISVVVQPFSYREKDKLSDAYYRNILHKAECIRMIGTKVKIVSPEYYGIAVFAEIAVHSHYIDAKERINKALEDYFGNVVAGFGADILYSEVYGLLDALECISNVRNLSFTTQGNKVLRTKNGDLKIPENGLVYLKSVDYIITSAEY